MRKITRAAKLNPLWRTLAHEISDDVAGKNWVGEIDAVFNWVRNNIRYRLDTNDIEVLQTPHVTTTMKSGDCDDHCILTATLLECLGHPCEFVAMGFDRAVENYSHVVTVVSGAGETPPIVVDTTEDEPLGWFPPGIEWTLRISIEG